MYVGEKCKTRMFVIFKSSNLNFNAFLSTRIVIKSSSLKILLKLIVVY